MMIMKNINFRFQINYINFTNGKNNKSVNFGENKGLSIEWL